MPSRRGFLATGGVVATAALAGCSVFDSMPDGITLAVDQPDPTPEPERTVVAYADLTDPERALVEKGFDGGYRTCDEVPEATRTFADRLDGENVFLSRDDELFGLWFTITDLVYADTTDPPDGDCGLF